MPTTQERAASQLLGFTGMAGLANGVAAFSLNAAANWLAFSYTPTEDKTLAKVQGYCSSVTLSPIAADADCELYSSAAQVPNASLEAKGADANPAVDFIQWSGFTSALTAGTHYWFVFKNLNALPATNFFSLRYWGGNGFPPALCGLVTSASAFAKRQSADSGATWTTTPLSQCAFIRLEFSDGSMDGFPFSTGAAVAAADRVFADDELGVQITTPSNGVLNVRGLQFFPAKIGTPTGQLRYRLYSGSTPSLLATTAPVPVANLVATAQGFPISLYFPTTQVIQPGTILTSVMAEETNSDANTNAFSTIEFTIQNTAASKALMPFGGMKKARFDGTTWTLTDTSIIPFALILDTDGEFAGGGGGPVGQQCM